MTAGTCDTLLNNTDISRAEVRHWVNTSLFISLWPCCHLVPYQVLSQLYETCLQQGWGLTGGQGGGMTDHWLPRTGVRKNPPAKLGRSKSKSGSRLHGVQAHLKRKLKMGEETIIDMNLRSAVSVAGGNSPNKLQCVSVYRK